MLLDIALLKDPRTVRVLYFEYPCSVVPRPRIGLLCFGGGALLLCITRTPPLLIFREDLVDVGAIDSALEPLARQPETHGRCVSFILSSQ